jgi:UDP-N-acetylmuramyl pentapeptide phosphotransferase/UDP-N-acetylglucosamine-1-phosphate transferase
VLERAATFGLLGAYDDYQKIKKNNSSGVSSKFKILIQILLALIGILILYIFSDSSELKNLYFPFFKNFIINLGWFFIPFYLFVIVGSSNAVNLTRWIRWISNSACYIGRCLLCIH